MMAAVDVRVKLACLVAFCVAAIHAHSPVALAVYLVVAVGLAAYTRLPVSSALRVLRPLVPIVVITIVMQVLVYQEGTPLVQWGGFALTTTAMAQAARMVCSLFAVMLANVAFMRMASTEQLTDALRWYLAPLAFAGANVDAFVMASSVAFGFVPVLVGEFGQLKRSQQARLASFEGGVRQRLASYTRLFAPLVRSSFRHADALAQAMVARCLTTGRARSSLEPGTFTLRDVACLVATIALVAVSSF